MGSATSRGAEVETCEELDIDPVFASMPPDLVYKIIAAIPVHDTMACASSALISREANDIWRGRVLENIPQFRLYDEDSIIMDADALGTYFLLKALLVYEVDPETIFELAIQKTRLDLSKILNIFVTLDMRNIESIDPLINQTHIDRAIQRTSVLYKFRECLMRKQDVRDEKSWADILIKYGKYEDDNFISWGYLCKTAGCYS